jgi:hypothetical protein
MITTQVKEEVLLQQVEQKSYNLSMICYRQNNKDPAVLTDLISYFRYEKRQQLVLLLVRKVNPQTGY